MGFLGVYRAAYDYAPQAENELELQEGDLLFVLERSTDDDWWRAKKKASRDGDEEPEGLIPSNYIEEVLPEAKARVLYDYTRQTAEELSLKEDELLDVYDASEPDWTLVGHSGEFGFAPSNYIEITEPGASKPPVTDEAAAKQAPPQRRSPVTSSVSQSPAAALAGIIQQKASPVAPVVTRQLATSPPLPPISPPRAKHTAGEIDEDENPSIPRLPARSSSHRSPAALTLRSTQTVDRPFVRSPSGRNGDLSYEQALQSPNLGGYHLYNVHELVSSLGKNKKLPFTLGINVPKGVIMMSPEKSRDGPSQQWTAEKLTNYSIEGKHVFMDLVRPSKNIDIHAGAKDTAEEIVSALGELAGAARAEGLREVLAATAGGTSHQQGVMLYEFVAQGDDEVTVAAGEEVTIIDDSKSDEWWMVRRGKNGSEGVVPSSYVERTGIISTNAFGSGSRPERSFVEQNRIEEESLAREATRSKMKRDNSGAKGSEKGKRDSKDGRTHSRHSKPDATKMRTWTDRSNNFKVDAQFIGLKDNKIHLHKGNGVKIAVPVQKMAVGDLEYVESVTGASLEDDKPLSEVRRKPSTRRTDHGADEVRSSTARAGATISHSKRSDYDWFDFFLQCGVNPQICERYAASFARDEMREESQPDIDSPLLRTLGLKEGDILRVMKYLDNKFGRSSTSAANPASGGNSTERGGSLFSGPGGALKNNTRKGRPAPSNQISDTVDAKALEQYSEESNSQSQKHTTGIAQDDERTGQFDDDAWRPKATSQTQTAIKPAGSATSQAASQKPTVVGSFADLSLLSPPLQPTPAARAAPPVATKQAPVVQQSDLQPQRPPGANSTLFDQVARSTVPQSTGPQYMLEQQGQIAAQPSYPGNVSRQRPAPPLASYQNSLIAPPPARASSAPQDPSQTSVFGPPNLQPQLTGYQGTTAISPGIAPPGQSLQELQQQRTQIYVPNLQTPLAGPAGFMGGGPGQQPYQASFLAQPTGAFSLQQPQATGFMQSNGQQYGPGPQTGTLYPSLNGNTLQSHATGLQTGIVGPASALQAQQTGVNAYLPPAMQPQPTGVARLTAQNFSSIPPVPPLPQQPTMAPLVPQKTGPAPPVRFGVSESAKKLVPQPTGRRANLSQATPENPFGF